MKSDITGLLKKWRLIRILELLLMAVSFASVATALLSLYLGKELVIFAFLMFFFGFLLFRFLTTAHHIVDQKELEIFLDEHFPKLENSSSLLFRNKKDLSGLAALQYGKISGVFEELKSHIKLPNRLLTYFIILICSGVLSFIITKWGPKVQKVETEQISTGPFGHSYYQGLDSASLHPILDTVIVTFQFPSYTGLPKATHHHLDINVLKGTDVTWELRFNKSVDSAFFIFANLDTLKLEKKTGGFYAKQKVENSSLYRLISWRDGVEYDYKVFSRQEVIPDLAPKIEVSGVEPFMRMDFDSTFSLKIEAKIKDDFHVRDAWIIATVSKGSGESVKFREERIEFDSREKLKTNIVSFHKKLKLKDLGLEPGDELYFYVVAKDNHEPIPQFSRSSTYHLVLNDTTRVVTSVLEGKGIDQMPEYFRSQRQIIIDTEKLIKDKVNIGRADFKNRSNMLANDQKILRLRYGQFLGEEFESFIGPGVESLLESVNSEKDGHVSEEEENHHAPEEGSDREGSSFGTIGIEAHQYIHNHDPAGTSTFFDDQIKATLKAALANMWEAELRLRLFEPQKALKFENMALDLIKQVQQKSRVYVERLGFDPPPLKPEESRFSGDLKEIRHLTFGNQFQEKDDIELIQQAVEIIEIQKQGGSKIEDDNKEVLKIAGDHLAAFLLDNPGQDLSVLSILHKLLENEGFAQKDYEELDELQQTFLKALPNSRVSLSKQEGKRQSLQDIFLEEFGTN
ncbi:hypothetical protein [Xanthovirga aplysinae]|uniref:hypothetical protein n=1 Tax=Xanthovirga aplysinae TaxID=2529853 RepID=UPI001CA3F30E|nr:hypothetical protein [Xanthovirga aplysinae]MTI31826.1 hypothetical protein [Xanthovirga aplysinae]